MLLQLHPDTRTRVENQNTPQYLESIRMQVRARRGSLFFLFHVKTFAPCVLNWYTASFLAQVDENLRALAGAPGVQMQEVPPDLLAIKVAPRPFYHPPFIFFFYFVFAHAYERPCLASTLTGVLVVVVVVVVVVQNLRDDSLGDPDERISQRCRACLCVLFTRVLMLHTSCF